MPIYRSRSATAGTPYTRPADWLTVPTPTANQINILAAVFPAGDNYAALNVTVTGGYTVDWGDGTTDNVASGVTAYHQYLYAGISQTPTSRGYKQSVVRITTQVGGGNITAFDISSKHTAFGAANPGSSPWLDVAVNTPSATSIVFSGTVAADYLEICTIVACGNVTSLSSTWQSCYALQSLILPSGFGASVTSLSNTWNGCTALQSLILPSGFGASATSLSSTWQSCYALQSLIGLSLPITFSLNSSVLGATALNAIYTALPTVAAATLTVSANYGYADSTPSIAVTKNWIVN